MKAPTRALVVEDIDSWGFTLSRAARRAGASEVETCKNLEEVKKALRIARFDIAILDIGLDPDDDVNADGIAALEMIRETDGGGTRCILVTGWQGGDRMDLQAKAQQKYGVDWAYMKEKYEAHAVIAKLTELLGQAAERRLSTTTPMGNLGANMEGWDFENRLLTALSPNNGIRTLYSVASRLISSAIPLVALHPDMPMKENAEGVWLGVYWSRALASAVAVGLASADVVQNDDNDATAAFDGFIPAGVTPDLMERVRERDVYGWLWELPELDRREFGE
jgi:ActR/RegA family two-component response regulator